MKHKEWRVCDGRRLFCDDPLSFPRGKPSWKDAPIDAQWLACDADGMWFWYAYRPNLDEDMWVNDVLANWDFGPPYCPASQHTGKRNRRWKYSLEKRPENALTSLWDCTLWDEWWFLLALLVVAGMLLWSAAQGWLP